jgi:hypothetical protein
LTQLAPHRVVGGVVAGHEHVPLTQLDAAGQAMPHLPQSVLLVLRSTQPSLHSVLPEAHAQLPAVQTSVAAQALVHVPQLLGSVASTVHEPPQTTCPAAQPVAHEAVPASLAEHTGVAAGHDAPHAPQFVAVVAFVVQPVPASAQSAKPPVHWYEHLPALHARPALLTCGSAAQLCPQPPQLFTSVPCTSTHWPAHSVVPEGHWHVPLWQVAPPAHAVHDEPQCIESVVASTHVLPQSVCPGGHAQTPAWHVSPPLQAWPHVPHCVRSLWRLAHVPAQLV